VMCGGSILSCCPHNPHGHERALKEEEKVDFNSIRLSVSSTLAVFFLEN